MFYFDQVIEWNLKHWSMTDWTYQIIQDPEELAPNILPDDFKLIIAEKFRKSKYSKFLQPLLNTVNIPCDPTLLRRFKDKMKTQDKFRKIDANDFVPEMVDYLY